jgi:hypothetical protein
VVVSKGALDNLGWRTRLNVGGTSGLVDSKRGVKGAA